jgi:hypothetical protein
MLEYERIGRERGMTKAMLTCLKSKSPVTYRRRRLSKVGNTSGLAFYEKFKYVPDEIDPTRLNEEGDEGEEDDGMESGDEIPEVYDYRILSKLLQDVKDVR